MDPKNNSKAVLQRQVQILQLALAAELAADFLDRSSGGKEEQAAKKKYLEIQKQLEGLKLTNEERRWIKSLGEF